MKDKIFIKKFSRRRESKIGADWEWWFVDNSKGLGLRVQAKRLRADGKRRRYEELKKDQANRLIQEAGRAKPPYYPIYCFYNPRSFVNRRHLLYFDLFWRLDCEWARNRAMDLPTMFGPCGCTIADARFVQAAVAANRRDLDTILLGSFPLWCLVCCCLNPINQPVSGIAEVAAAAAQNVRQGAREAARALGLPYGDGGEIGAGPEPIPRDRLPEYVSRLMSGGPSDESIEELQGVVVFSGQG